MSGGESTRSVVVRTKTDFGYAKIDRCQSNVVENVVQKADFYRGETLGSRFQRRRIAAAPLYSKPYLSAAVSVGIETFSKTPFLRSLTERAENDKYKKIKSMIMFLYQFVLKRYGN